MISVGIDVSKGKSMICILKPYGEVVVSPYEVIHEEKYIAALVDLISSLKGEVRVVMEATGAYHLPVLLKLIQSSIYVSIINPLVMKKYASTSIRKGKTDKMDSVKIANYGLDNWFHLNSYRPSAEVYEELRILGRQYAHYISMRVSALNNLTSILDRTMPGIKPMLTSTNGNKTKSKLCDFVETYWHLNNITGKSEKKFINEYYKWAKKKGYHHNERKARGIYAVAQNGIPTLSSSTPSTKMLVLEGVRVLREVDKTLAVIIAQMNNAASTLPEYPVVLAMKGVGDTLGPRLIAEIGDIRRFHSGSALVAYAGLDAPPFQSGSFEGTKRSISKRGSKLLRKTGYEIMKMLKVSKPTEDAAVYQFILKKEAEGKHKKIAKIAGLNKFLRIYYARVKEVYSVKLSLDLTAIII